MRLQSLDFSTIVGGPYHGAAAFFLDLSKGENETTVQHVLDEISAFRSKLTHREVPIVVEDHTRTFPSEDHEVLKLVTTLREQSVPAIGYMNGEDRPMWMEACTYRRVIRDSTKPDGWMQFNTNEFALSVTEVLPEAPPKLEENNRDATRILLCTANVSIQDAWRFVSKAEKPWRIIYPERYQMNVVIM